MVLNKCKSPTKPWFLGGRDYNDTSVCDCMSIKLIYYYLINTSLVHMCAHVQNTIYMHTSRETT